MYIFMHIIVHFTHLVLEMDQISIPAFGQISETVKLVSGGHIIGNFSIRSIPTYII